MALQEWLLNVLACPADKHAPLHHDSGNATLTCDRCGQTYHIEDGIPVLFPQLSPATKNGAL